MGSVFPRKLKITTALCTGRLFIAAWILGSLPVGPRKDIRMFEYIIFRYNRLSSSRIPRDCLIHLQISVPRHIRFAELRKTINRTTIFNKRICNLTPEVRDYCKYCGTEEKLFLRSSFSSFPQYFVTCC